MRRPPALSIAYGDQACGPLGEGDDGSKRTVRVEQIMGTAIWVEPVVNRAGSGVLRDRPHLSLLR